MAELSIGEHCSVAYCKRLDFLPITCNGCGLLFCKDHMSYDAHGCSLCLLAMPDGSAYQGPRSYRCSFENCTNRELTAIACDACLENFCLAHRHETEHNCRATVMRSERMLQTAKHVQSIVSRTSAPLAGDKNPKRQPASQKSKTTASKIALMKLKQKAIGDSGIPESERVFLNVALPHGSQSKSMAMFFSDKWYVGKVVDKIAAATGLRNDNNTSAARKLFLFESTSGGICKNDETLASLLQEETGAVFNGCTVILEYITGDTKRLASLESYI